MNELLRSSIAAKTLGVLPPRVQRAVKHGKRALRPVLSGNLPGWQLCHGISGSFRVDWVAGFLRTQSCIERSKFASHHLAGAGLGQVIDELDGPRHLVSSKMLTAELDNVVGIRR